MEGLLAQPSRGGSNDSTLIMIPQTIDDVGDVRPSTTKQVSNGNAAEAVLAEAIGLPIHQDSQERWEKISVPHVLTPKLKKLAESVVPLLNIDGESLQLKDDGKNGIKADLQPVNKYAVPTSAGISNKHNNNEMHTKRIYEKSLYEQFAGIESWKDLPVRDFSSFSEWLADSLTIDSIHKHLGLTSYYHVYMKQKKAGYYADVTFFDKDRYPTRIIGIVKPVHNRIVVTLDNSWVLDYRLKNKDRAIKVGSIDASLTLIQHPYDTTRVM